MRFNTETDHEVADDAAPGTEPSAKPPRWPLALASIGICLATAAAIALIALLA
jgi:hypothetical protein